MSRLDDTELAQQAMDGVSEAFGELFERWFDRAFDVAWHIVRNRDTAAEVAQEAFAVAWHQISGLRQPASFGGWILRITRNKALSRMARDRRTSLVGDDESMDTLDPRPPSTASPVDPMIERERDDLVWVASAVLGPDDASLLSLHLRHELGAAELAGELGVQANAVHQRLLRLRRRLGDAIGAWILWREGAPSCSSLRAELGDPGADPGGLRFTRPTAAAIVTHARHCTDCDRDRQLQLSPDALFCAVPMVAAGPLVRAEAASALEGMGVPASSGSRPSGDPQSGQPSNGHPRAGRPRGKRSTSRTVAMASAAAVAVVVGLVALADQAGDGPQDASVEAPSSDPDQSDTAAVDQTEPGLSPGGGSPPTDAPAPTEPAPGPAPEPNPGSGGQPSTTVTTAPSPPTITGFTATPGSGTCSAASEVAIILTWSTTGATTATLGAVGGSADGVETSGSASKCSPLGASWTLSVTGPGGGANATTTAPGRSRKQLP